MLELDGRTLTHEQFCNFCLKVNLPAIIRNAAVERDDRGKESFFCLEHMRARLSPEGLIYAFGKQHDVPTFKITGDSSPGGDDTGECVECHTRSLGQVMECWRRGEGGLYLKDWHMQLDSESCARHLESRRVAEGVEREYNCVGHGDGLYRVPDYLGDDWMNEFCLGVRDDGADCHRFGDKKGDYRFAYIGPSSTWTPLHFDVFGTYSWSLNVCGEKLWFFPSPEGNRRLMENSLHGVMLPVDIRTTTDVELWSVVQRPGDLVFVPSTYLHQVHNLRGSLFSLPEADVESTESAVDASKNEISAAGNGAVSLVISINHNWCNEWCVENMVETFCRDARRIGRLLTEEDRVALFGDDIDAWRNHVERMLISGTNWNFASIRSFLKYRLTRLDAPIHDAGVGAVLRRLLEKVDAVELSTTHFSGHER